MTNIKRLIDKYTSYLNDSFIVEKIEKNIYKIITPYIDRRNDNIIIYAIFENDYITLTDDSYTIDDLELSGIKIDKKRESDIKKILLGYGVKIDDRKLYITATHSSFAQKKHNFIQALLNVNDMYMISRERVVSLFLDDIQSFFDKKEIVYTQGLSIAGFSGITHKFDFIIPKQVTPYKKEVVIKAINNPKLANIKAQIFSFEDIRKNSRDTADFVILNDIHNHIDNKIVEAFNNYEINSILWSRRDTEIERFRMAS